MQTFCQLDLNAASQRRKNGLDGGIDPLLIHLCTEVVGVKLALMQQVAAPPGFTNSYDRQNCNT
jgi:hypothetical protein